MMFFSGADGASAREALRLIAAQPAQHAV